MKCYLNNREAMATPDTPRCQKFFFYIIIIIITLQCLNQTLPV